jgi:hypothetical protein
VLFAFHFPMPQGCFDLPRPRRRRSTGQRRVWLFGVVLYPRSFRQDLHFLQRVEDLSVQELVAQLRVETFTVAVFPWSFWGTFGPSRRQILSTRSFPTFQRASCSLIVMPIAVPTIAVSQRDDGPGQCVFIVPPCRLVALRATRLVNQVAHMSLAVAGSLVLR